MNVSGHGWNLFPAPPSSTDSDEPGVRLQEMMKDARDTHRDHFENRIQAFAPPRDVEAAAPAPVPVVNADPPRSFPRTVAVSLVLLVVAGSGTLITTVLNALINKSIMNNGGKTGSGV